MLKLSRNHTIYEVFNEWAAESVFIDHKPAASEIKQIVIENNWVPSLYADADLFIQSQISVQKVKHFYTSPKCMKCPTGRL